MTRNAPAAFSQKTKPGVNVADNGSAKRLGAVPWASYCIKRQWPVDCGEIDEPVALDVKLVPQEGVIWNRLIPVAASAKGSTRVPRDFTTGSLGVRLYDDFCTVIIRKSGVDGWLEDGQRFPLPLPDGFDSIVTIPASTLALAVSTFEAINPGSGLREMLTQKPRAPRD